PPRLRRIPCRRRRGARTAARAARRALPGQPLLPAHPPAGPPMNRHDPEVEQVAADAAAFRRDLRRLADEIARVIVGSEPVVDGVLTALVAGGHVLLEGVPGLGKTMLVRTLAEAVDLSFARIQFTPDLMP